MKNFHLADSIQIYPLAGESFGVRSFCFLIKTPDFGILLDPGCALGPKRYKLPPHPLEFKQQRELTNEIIKSSKNANFIFISHFHHDHFKPNIRDNFCVYSNRQIFNELYRNKTIIMKNFKEKINFNQQKRGKKFSNDVKNIANSIIIAGSQELSIKKSKFNLSSIGEKLLKNPDIKEILSIKECDLIFPGEFHHGKRPKNNIFVQPIIIRNNTDVFYYFPDVEGFPYLQDMNSLLSIKKMIKIAISDKFGVKKEQNHIIAFGGPPTYILTSRNSRQDNLILRDSLQNSTNIIKSFNTSLIDHHLIRDINYMNYLKQFVIEIEKNNNHILTMNSKLFSNFSKNQNSNAFETILNIEKEIPLECNREMLFKKHPPSSEFYHWLKEAERSLTDNDPPYR